MALGSDRNAQSEDSFLADMPIVLTASRLSQPIDEAPAAVTIIDRQMIRDSGAWDLSEVFRLVPGMYVAYHATDTYTTESTVSYHGLSDAYSHRMQVLVDGRSVYSPIFGGTLWSDIPLALDDIERIEVIRGPDSASYGANSFMGVINIITRHSAESQGGMLSLSTGRHRDEAVARFGGQNGDLTYRLTAGTRNDQGENTKITRPLSTLDNWDNNKLDDKRTHLLTFRSDYRINATDEMEFQFGYNGGTRQEGWSDSIIALDGRSVSNQFELLKWSRAHEDGGGLSVQFYHANESSTATLFDMQHGNTMNGDTKADRYDLELQHTLLPSSSTRIVWGGSVRSDYVYAPIYFKNSITNAPQYQEQSFFLSRLFGNLEWRARPDLIFNLGAMSENNSYTGNDITPRIAVNWHVVPNHTLRASYSEATRTPTMYEKNREVAYLGTYLSKEMDREQIKSSEIGYLGKFPGLNIDLRLFSDELSGLIAQTASAVLHNNLNSGKARVKGLEGQLQWDVGAQTRLIYSFSHIEIDSSNLDNMTYTMAAPRNSQSMMLTHRFNQNWNASLMNYQVGATHFPGSDAGPGDNPQYFIDFNRRWDARLAYRFKAGRSNGELALIVQNLDDSHYFEYRHDNELPGRSAWLNLKLEM
ncbi:MAG: TonB-dependent receptor [Sulfuricella sp.]